MASFIILFIINVLLFINVSSFNWLIILYTGTFLLPPPCPPTLALVCGPALVFFFPRRPGGVPGGEVDLSHGTAPSSCTRPGRDSAPVASGLVRMRGRATISCARDAGPLTLRRHAPAFHRRVAASLGWELLKAGFACLFIDGRFLVPGIVQYG